MPTASSWPTMKIKEAIVQMIGNCEHWLQKKLLLVQWLCQMAQNRGEHHTTTDLKLCQVNEIYGVSNRTLPD